ncbi:hypothetical protein NHJ13734_006052 [Beauveria thailandica]
MASTIAQLLLTHPTNHVHETGYITSTKKEWAKKYKPIRNVTIHTSGQRGEVIADFSAFLPEEADDQRRTSVLAYPPNQQSWRMDTEADARHWFYHEVSDVVMPAFASYPPVVQVSEAKPFSEENIVQVVDDSFTFKPPGGSQMPLVIGEFKRNIVDYREWQTGKIATSLQISLSRELRGYAVKYNCPQVFCFDGYTLLMLQFKARKPEAIADEDCDIDCWLFRRRNLGGTTLRYALYRLLAQGLRRVQGQLSRNPALLNSQECKFRNFYTGEPIWKIDGVLHRHPWGMYRAVDPKDGSIYWMYNGQPVWGEDGLLILDGPPLYTS